MISRRDFTRSALSAAVAAALYPYASGARVPRGFTPKGLNPIGVNIVDAFIGDGGIPFTQDRVPSSTGFGTVASGGGTPTTLTAAGWPATDFICVLANSPTVMSWQTGTWKCGFIGTGSETVAAFDNCTVTNVVNSSGHVTFDLTPSGSTFGVKVTGTTGGVTNFIAYIPAYGANAALFGYQAIPLFTNEAINVYKVYRRLRWMNCTNVINNNTVQTSANRVTPSNVKCSANAASAASGINIASEAIPQEWFAAFCAAANTGYYANFPLGADPTWIAAALAAIAAQMPTGELDIELSNEVWNGAGAGESAFLTSLSSAYNTANPGVLNYDGDNTAGTLRYRYLAIRLHDLAVACQTQFGAAFGPNGRVKVRFMTQGAQAPTFYNLVIPFLIHQYGANPNQWVQVIGSAPYFGRDNTLVPGDGTNWTGNTSVTTAQVLTELTNNAAYQQWLPNSQTEHQKAFALSYGMQLKGYEGGFGNDPGSADFNFANIGAAIQNAAMQGITASNTFNLINAGYDEICNFSSGVDVETEASAPDYQFSTDYASFIASGSPRSLGLATYFGGITVSHRNTVSASGSVLNWVNYLDNTSTMSSANPTLTESNGIQAAFTFSCGILVYCTRPGTYAMNLAFTGSGGTTSVRLNNTVINASASLASSPANLGNITLAQGFNYIELGGSFQTVTLISSTFT